MANLVNNTSGEFVIASDLYVAEVNSKSGTIFARSGLGVNNPVKAVPAGKTAYDDPSAFVQDNWLEIKVGSGDIAGITQGKTIAAGTLNGTLSATNGNYRINTAYKPLLSNKKGAYVQDMNKVNSYLVANFLSTAAQGDYFFMEPQPNEVAKLRYPVYRDGKLYMHANNDLEGVSTEEGINVDTSTYWTDAAAWGATNNNGYEELTVIVKKNGSSSNAPALNGPRRANAAGTYSVSAVSSNGQVVTAVEDVKAPAGEVVAVRYFNLMGAESDKPFEGINVVITIYSDGTHTATKRLF